MVTGIVGWVGGLDSWDSFVKGNVSEGHPWNPKPPTQTTN